MISRLKSTLAHPWSTVKVSPEDLRKLHTKLINNLPADTRGVAMVEVHGVYDSRILLHAGLDHKQPGSIVPIARVIADDKSMSKVYVEANLALEEVVEHCAYGIALIDLSVRFYQHAIVQHARPGSAEHLMLNAIAHTVRDTCARSKIHDDVTNETNKCVASVLLSEKGEKP